MSGNDTLAAAWVRAVDHHVSRVLEDVPRDAGWGMTKVRLAINDTAACLHFRSKGSAAKTGFEAEAFKGEAFDAMVAAIRASCSDKAWPVMIRLEIDHSRRWSPVSIVEYGMAGQWLREPRGGKDARPLDDIAEASQLIDRMCPPTNRPIRAWSSQSNLSGADFVNVEEIHARSEAEAILKELHNILGLQRLRDIAAGGPMPDEDWITSVRFIAADIEDLDLDPMGRRLTGRDALSQISDFMQSQKQSNDQVPEF